MDHVPRYIKKKLALERKELAVKQLIGCGATEEKLLTAAQDVNDARIRVLRTWRATIVPKGDFDEQYEKIDNKIQAIIETSPLTILAEFGHSASEGDTHQR